MSAGLDPRAGRRGPGWITRKETEGDADQQQGDDEQEPRGCANMSAIYAVDRWLSTLRIAERSARTTP